MEHEVRFERGIVIVRVWGKADPDGYAETTASIVSLLDWKTGTPILVDYEDLDLTVATIADVRAFAGASARFRKELGHCLCAVVNSKSLDFGMARMWQVFMNIASDVEVAVFYRVEDAMSWLEENMKHGC